MNELPATAHDTSDLLRLHRAALVGEFTRTLSHDLTLLLSELLAQTDHAAAQRDSSLWHIALKQNLQTAGRIEQLAARFRHAAALLEVERKRVDLKDVAAVALQALSHHTRAKHMQVISELWDALPIEQPVGACFHLVCAAILRLLQAASAGSALTVKAHVTPGAIVLILHLSPISSQLNDCSIGGIGTQLAAHLGVAISCANDDHGSQLALQFSRSHLGGVVQ